MKLVKFRNGKWGVAQRAASRLWLEWEFLDLDEINKKSPRLLWSMSDDNIEKYCQVASEDKAKELMLNYTQKKVYKLADIETVVSDIKFGNIPYGKN